MKFTRAKESCIQPVNLQLNEHNDSMRPYHISLLQSTKQNQSSDPTQVAASPSPPYSHPEVNMLL